MIFTYVAWIIIATVATAKLVYSFFESLKKNAPLPISICLVGWSITCILILIDNLNKIYMFEANKDIILEITVAVFTINIAITFIGGYQYAARNNNETGKRTALIRGSIIVLAIIVFEYIKGTGLIFKFIKSLLY